MGIGLIEQPPGDGYEYRYDRENHKIKIFTSAGFTPAGTVSQPTFAGAAVEAAGLAELDPAVTPAATTLRMLFVGE